MKVVKEVAIGSWKAMVGGREVVPVSLTKELELFLEKWREVMIEELAGSSLWSMKYLKVPSPLVGLDMAPTYSWTTGRRLESIYEIMAQPSRLGLFCHLSSEEQIERWRRALRSCRGFVNIGRKDCPDDSVAARALSLPYYEEIPSKDRGPYWIRAKDVAGIEKQSLTPVRDNGRSCLVRLGMAVMASPFQLQELDWEEPFVIKPLSSGKGGVEIYLPYRLKKGLGIEEGVSVKSRIRQKAIEPSVVQRFILPQERAVNGRRGWTTWRLFFGFEGGRYVCIGGLWTWRQNLGVYGSLRSDAVVGTLEIR